MTTGKVTYYARSIISILGVLCILVTLLSPVIHSQIIFDQQSETSLDSEWGKVADTEDIQDWWASSADDDHFSIGRSSLVLSVVYSFRQLHGCYEINVPPPEA